MPNPICRGAGKLKARAGFSDLRQPLLCGPRFRMRLHPENEWRFDLVDTLYEEFADQIPKSMQQLKLNPKDIKYIIVTHAHTDHTGGANALQALTGARVGMAEGDWQMNGLGTYTSSGGQHRQFKPIRRDLVIK